MPGVDTNVLVRWLVADDALQVRQVQRIFREAVASGQQMFVPISVSLELEWVLRARYGFDRASVAQTFIALLEARELQFQDEAAIERALHLFRHPPSADFADCLHAALCAIAAQSPLLTFDAAAARLEGVKRIG